MKTEQKKYLIDVESNLKEYTDQAALASVEIERLQREIKNLKIESLDDVKVREQLKAQLKDQQQQYRNAQTNVVNLTQAVKAQKGSYQELYQQWKVLQTQLKLMPNMYTINEQGVRELSQEYVEQSRRVAEAKASLDSFGKGVHDNRLNVGSYSEALEGMAGKFGMIPGPIGQVSMGLQRMTAASKAFIATGIGLVIAAIAGGILLLVKAFKNSQPLMDAFQRGGQAIAATIKVLIDRVSNFAEFLGSIFSKELRESRREAKALNDELIGIEETMSRREKREIRRANKKGFFEEIREEAAAARDLTKAEQDLEDAEIAFIQRRAEMTRQIEEMFASTKDENLSDLQRIENLDKAIALTKEMTAIEVEFAKERARISQERVDQGNSTREELRLNEEAQAAATEAEAQGFKEIKRLASERFSLLKRLGQEAANEAKARVALAEKEMTDSKARLEKEIADYKKFLADQKAADEKAAEERRQRQIEQAEWEREQRLLQQEQLLQIRELTTRDEFGVQRELLRMQMEEELRMYEDNLQMQNLVRQKYSLAQKQIDESELNSRLQLYGNFAGSLAQLFGENTAIGRAAAVAQATIATYTAATEAYKSLAGIPVVGPALGAVAAATTIAMGLANVRRILSVKSGLPGDSGGGSAPTAISSSVPAQRIFARQAQPTGLSQPQLSQEQLNALPQTKPLTAEDIAAAIARMPRPVVTVEDINARASETSKVEVVATI